MKKFLEFSEPSLAIIVVILVSAMVVIVFFRKDFSRLLARLQNVKFPWGAEAEFTGCKPVERELPARLEGEKEGIWAKTGNLFWLGHDIGFAVVLISKNGNKKDVSDALGCIIHHAKSLGLDDYASKSGRLVPIMYPKEFVPTTMNPHASSLLTETITGRLVRLTMEVAKMTVGAWGAKNKTVFLHELDQIRRLVGRLAEENQPGFSPRP